MKFGEARLRDQGHLAVHADWRGRVAACAACPLRVVVGGRSWCGRPMTQRSLLRPADEPGCGCPIDDKARDPRERCARHDPVAADCACPWCAAGVG